MMTFQQFMATFPDEDACRRYLFERRWPDAKVKCPRCEKSETVYPLKTMPWRWECSNPGCRSGNAYRFSLLVATVFEDTKIPLVTWFKVLYAMLQSKKGISSRQVRRMFFGETSSLHTAWYVCHRLRAAMRDAEFRQLMRIVEIDETYIGGKGKNRHKKDRFRGRGTVGKISVIGAMARKGNIICQIIENTDTLTIDRYVRGQVQTQHIDSFWALLKRGIVGTYHNVSKKYLPLYLAEFQFRHNIATMRTSSDRQ